MKKLITALVFSICLAACSPQTPPTETMAPSQSSDDASSEVKKEPSTETTSKPNVQTSSVSESAQAPEASDTQDVPDVVVPSRLSIVYGENSVSFVQSLTVHQSLSYKGDTNTILVERYNENGIWERVRGNDTGIFTLEGKLVVKGPLPERILEDVLASTPYRVTTRLTSEQAPIIAQNTFLAGNAFDEKTTPTNMASPQTIEMALAVTAQADRSLVHQTITNKSDQTVLIEDSYQIVEQNANGLWTRVPLSVQRTTQASPMLLPGASFTHEETIALSSTVLKKGTYQMTRSAKVIKPLPIQPAVFEFSTQLASQPTVPTPKDSVNTAILSDVSVLLEQTSFAAGEATIRAYVKNMSEKPIVASKVRVYNVKDGQEIYPGETTSASVTVAARETFLVLEQVFEPQVGEYAVEVVLHEAVSKEQVMLLKNFSVEAKGIRNPASASTVDMHVVVASGQGDLASCSQVFTNKSSQTLMISRAFRVETQVNGQWVPAEYPSGQTPVFAQDLVLLYPGESVALEGALPFAEKDAEQTYRIARTMQVINPLPNQQNGLTLVYTVTKKANRGG